MSIMSQLLTEVINYSSHLKLMDLGGGIRLDGESLESHCGQKRPPLISSKKFKTSGKLP